MSNPYLIQVDKAALQHVANKTAVVTGGCSGIGLATVKLMASLGCNVLVGDLQDQPADEDGLFAHENVRYRQCDISKWESLASFFATASTCFGGPIDIVAANAGINEYGDQLSRTRRDAAGKWLEPDYRTLDVDLKGAINTVALALNHFDTTRGGSIILTASLAGYQGTGNMPIYSAAKHGVWGLMQSLKHSTPTQKVAISLVAPGFVPTPIMSDLPGQEDKSLDEVFALLHAAGLRSSRPETVASAIVYLADGGLAHNGTALSVNDDKVVNLEALLRDNRPEYVRNELGYLFSSSI